MKRRHFIALSATALAGVSIPFGCSSENYSGLVAIMPKPLPLSKFCNEKDLKNIGTKYLQNVPGENEVSKLGQHIFKNEAGQLVDPDPTAIAKLFDEKITKDFHADNTTVVDGWVISLTEARVCGVLSLV